MAIEAGDSGNHIEDFANLVQDRVKEICHLLKDYSPEMRRDLIDSLTQMSAKLSISAARWTEDLGWMEHRFRAVWMESHPETFPRDD